MKTLYTARATSTEGRNGHAETDDGALTLELASPGAPNAKPGTTNPEQLFACGYAGCFGSALELTAKQQKSSAKDITIKSEVSLNQDDNGYFLAVVLNISMSGVAQGEAEKLAEAAHQICPYSKATRGNIDVALNVSAEQAEAA